MSDAGVTNGGDAMNFGEGPPRPDHRPICEGSLVRESRRADDADGAAAIDLGVDLQARRLDPERYEVELKLRVSAKAEDKTGVSA